MVPSRWRQKTLEEICTKIGDGIHSTPKYSTKSDCYFINGNNLKNGVISISEATKFVSSSELDKQKIELSKSSILMSINGTIGNLAKYRGEKVLLGKSAAYINPDKENSSDFIYYVLQGEYAKRFFSSELSGSTIKNLSLKTIRNLKVLTPQLVEQKEIVRILSTWDKAITTTEQLLANSQQQKKALMQQLLTGKRRLLDKSGGRFDRDWKRIELGKLLDYQQPTQYLVSSTEYSDEYETPVLTAGKTFVLGKTNEKSGIFCENLPVIIFDDFTTATKFVDFPFKAKSSAMKILSAKEGVSIKFIFESMQMLGYQIGGHQRHWISIYSNLVIGLPDPQEQKAIAEVSNLADREVNALKSKVERLRLEKKSLMQQLLAGKRRVKTNKTEFSS